MEKQTSRWGLNSRVWEALRSFNWTLPSLHTSLPLCLGECLHALMATTTGFRLLFSYWSCSHLRTDSWEGKGRVARECTRWMMGDESTVIDQTHIKWPHLHFFEHQTWGCDRAGRTGWTTRLRSLTLNPMMHNLMEELLLKKKKKNTSFYQNHRERERERKGEVCGEEKRLPEVSLGGTSCWAPCSWLGLACSSDLYRIS